MTDSINEAYTLTADEAAALRQDFNYCPRCRTEMEDQEVYGRVRRVCPDPECRFVQFIDPKVSAAVLALKGGKVLMVQRSMDPAQGSWCFPGGFMEIDETPQQTAIRECKEESGFDVEITGLIDVYPYRDYRGGGVLIMYRGKVIGGRPDPDRESRAVAFFGPDELPENIQFDSNIKALAAWREGQL